jgi:hypothetical protein
MTNAANGISFNFRGIRLRQCALPPPSRVAALRALFGGAVASSADRLILPSRSGELCGMKLALIILGLLATSAAVYAACVFC